MKNKQTDKKIKETTTTCKKVSFLANKITCRPNFLCY